MNSLTEPSTAVDRTLAVLLAVVAALPWLSPLVYGPAPAVPGMLLAWSVVALLLWDSRHLNEEALAWGWLVAAVISSLIGLCQYFGIAREFVPWVIVAEGGQAYGNLRQRNQLATLVCIGWVALVFVALRYQIAGLRKQISLMVTAACLALGLAVSSSRTGLVELLALLGLASSWRWWRVRAVQRALVSGVGVYVLVVFLLPQLRTGSGETVLVRLQSAEPGCSSRLSLWHNMFELIKQRPWLGWGWGELDYAHFITIYDSTRQCEMLDNAHNLPLHLAVEMGLPMATLICAVLAWMTWRARPWREADLRRQMAWGVLMLIMVHSMLEHPLWYGPFQMATFLSLGLLRPKYLPERAWWQSHGKWYPRALSAALLIVITYAAWDYHRISQIYLPVEQRSAAYRDDTLERLQASWLFRDQVRFATYTLTPLTRSNAAELNSMGHKLLHFSPEPRVVEKLIDSALLLGRGDEAAFLSVRYHAAYPKDYARWSSRANGGTP